MTKKDDLEDRIAAIEIEKKIHDGINKWVRAICITTASAVMSSLYWLGGFIYNRSEAFEAAVKAFWVARKGSGHD